MELVTVAVPTYQRARTIAAAIDSALAQGPVPVEVIVVDDGSTDDTSDVVARYGARVKYLRQANRREGAARNAAIGAASGRYIAFLDSDDEWLPGKLVRDLSAFARTPDAALVFSRAEFVDASGRVRRVAPWRPPVSKGVGALLRANFIPLSTAVVRRDVLREVGSFSEDPSMSGSYDWDLWIRIWARYPIAFTGATAARMRTHPGNMMSDPSWMDRAMETAASSFTADPAVREHLRTSGCNPWAWVELQRALLWAFSPQLSSAGPHLRRAIRLDARVLRDVRAWKILARVVLGARAWSAGAAVLRPLIRQLTRIR